MSDAQFTPGGATSDDSADDTSGDTTEERTGQRTSDESGASTGSRGGNGGVAEPAAAGGAGRSGETSFAAGTGSDEPSGVQSRSAARQSERAGGESPDGFVPGARDAAQPKQSSTAASRAVGAQGSIPDAPQELEERSRQAARSYQAASAEEKQIRQQIAAENKNLQPQDIKAVDEVEDGQYRARLTDQARLEQARANFELERDQQRLFAGTERIPLYLDESDFELSLQDGEVQAQLNEQGRQKVQERQARETTPFVSKNEELNRGEEFLLSARKDQLESEAKTEDIPIAEASVPGSDKELLPYLEGLSENYQEGYQVAGIEVPGSTEVASAAGDVAASPSYAYAQPGATRVPTNAKSRRRSAEGAIETGLGLFNVPGIAAGAIKANQRVQATFGDQEAAARLATDTALIGATAASQAKENPSRTAGAVAGGVLGGVAAGRAVARSGSVARGLSIRARGGDIYEFDDLSNPPTVTKGGAGELPGYTRRAQQDPEYAKGEFREQAESGALAQENGGVTARLGVDPDSGSLTVSDDLQQAIRETARRPGQRASAVGQRAQQTAVAAGRTVRQAPGRAAQAARQAPATARRTAGEAATVARESAVGAARTVAELPLRARARARRVGEAYDQRVFQAGERFGQQLGSLDDAAFRAGERVGQGVSRLEEVPGQVRAAPGEAVNRLDDAAFRTGEQFESRLGDLDDAAFRLGERTGQRIAAVERLPGRAERRGRQAVRRLDDAAFEAGVTVGERFGALDDAAFETGRRTGRVTRRAEDRLRALSFPDTDDVSTPSFDQVLAAGRRRAFTARQRVSDVGDAYDARVEAAGRRAGERLGELDDAAFRAGERVGELPDLSLELDYQPASERAVAFHGRGREAVEEYGGFGTEFEAPGGTSELPGLFQSADLSELRFNDAGYTGGVNIGIPRPRRYTTKVMAEEDIELGITEGQTRRQVAEFLEEDASREQSFVRTDADGGPTGEQEVIAPPEAQFTSTGEVFGIRVGGRRIPFTDRRIGGEIVPGRVMRRQDANVDDTVAGSTADGDGVAGEQAARETTRALSRARRRQADVDVQPQPYSASRSQRQESEPVGALESSLSASSPSSVSSAGVSSGFSSASSFGYGSSVGGRSGATNGAASPSTSGSVGSPGVSPGTSTPTSTGYPYEYTSGFGGGGGGGGLLPVPGGGTEPLVPPRTSGRTDNDREIEPFFGGARESEFTDFFNPLSGQRLQTTAIGGEVPGVAEPFDEPELLGYVSTEIE